MLEAPYVCVIAFAFDGVAGTLVPPWVLVLSPTQRVGPPRSTSVNPQNLSPDKREGPTGWILSPIASDEHSRPWSSSQIATRRT